MTNGDNVGEIITAAYATAGRDDHERIAGEALRRVLDLAKSPNTRRAYEGDLKHFFAVLGEKEVTGGAVALLLDMDRARLVRTLEDYILIMRRARLSEATINRRLAAVRALVRKARLLGADTPDIAGLVDREKVEQLRDVDALTLTEVGLVLDAIAEQAEAGSLRARRDYALFLLLALNGLRRAEALGANVRDFDAKRGKLRIVGKGRSAAGERVTLPPDTIEAIGKYLKCREEADGGRAALPSEPLFLSLDHRIKGRDAGERRLTGAGFWEIARDYGKDVLGRSDLHPHSYRHTAITTALEATGGDVPLAQEFSRHKDANTLMIYRDRLRDGQGHVTALIAELLREVRAKKDN